MLAKAVRMPNAISWRLKELSELFPRTKEDIDVEITIVEMCLGMQATNPTEHEIDQCFARVELERLSVMPYVFKALYALIETLPSRLTGLLCILFGHAELEDEGWATPDSGCIEMVCKRCGKGYGRVWLY